MIGLDRPLRPEWIYNILKELKVGDNPKDYYLKFEEIASELVGKEGKRKVRTIIFRSFIFSMQESSSQISYNLFLEWVKVKKLEELKPIFLLKLLMDYEICRFIIRKTSLSIQPGNIISIPLLNKQVIKEYGDRDIVKRSFRSFLKTLEHFGFIYDLQKTTAKVGRNSILSEQQIHCFLILYGKYFLKAKSIDLNSIQEEFLYLFETPQIVDIAKKHHGQDWEYIRDVGRDVLYLK